MGRLTRDCWRHRGVTVGALLASTIGVGLEAVAPLLTRVAVDNAVRGVVAGLAALVAALLALAVIRFGAAFLRRYLGGQLSLDVQHDLRRAVLASVQRLDGPRQDTLRTGQVASRAISDLQQVQGLLAMVPLVAGYTVLLVASISAMVWLSPLLTVISLIMLPASVLLTARARRTLFPATWSAQQCAADIAQHVEETVTGVRVVKGFGQEAREVATLERRALRLYQERLRAARLTARLSPPLAALPSLGLVAVFGFGGLLALRGEITIGTFLAFSTYVSNLVGPARMIGSLVVTGQLARAGVERVYELIDSRPEVTDPIDPVDPPPGPLSVELDGVRFGYTSDQPVLDSVSIRIEPGETVALVGSAGLRTPATNRRSRHTVEVVPLDRLPVAEQVRGPGPNSPPLHPCGVTQTRRAAESMSLGDPQPLQLRQRPRAGVTLPGEPPHGRLTKWRTLVFQPHQDRPRPRRRGWPSDKGQHRHRTALIDTVHHHSTRRPAGSGAGSSGGVPQQRITGVSRKMITGSQPTGRQGCT
jgi:hypothetical protein